MNKDIIVGDITVNDKAINQSGIFKTEVNFNDEIYNNTKNPFIIDKTSTIGPQITLDVKLPNSCNFIALRYIIYNILI